MPSTIPLGGKEPATLEGRFDASGYTLQLAGSVIPEDLVALGNAIPVLGDGLKERLDEMAAMPHTNSLASQTANPTEGSWTAPAAPLRVDLTAARAWGGPQIWSNLAALPPQRKRPHSLDR
jgi:hypothetical protein